MTKRRELTEGEKTIIRNQRLIMVALLCAVNNIAAPGYDVRAAARDCAQNLHKRIRAMDEIWDWVAPPSHRTAPIKRK